MAKDGRSLIFSKRLIFASNSVDVCEMDNMGLSGGDEEEGSLIKPSFLLMLPAVLRRCPL